MFIQQRRNVLDDNSSIFKFYKLCERKICQENMMIYYRVIVIVGILQDEKTSWVQCVLMILQALLILSLY